MNGVKAKIMNGLNAWNQVTGICPVQTRRLMRAVGVVVGPQRDGVALLLVGRPEERHRQRQQQQRADGAPFVAAERRCVSPVGGARLRTSGGSVRAA